MMKTYIITAENGEIDDILTMTTADKDAYMAARANHSIGLFTEFEESVEEIYGLDD